MFLILFVDCWLAVLFSLCDFKISTIIKDDLAKLLQKKSHSTQKQHPSLATRISRNSAINFYPLFSRSASVWSSPSTILSIFRYRMGSCWFRSAFVLVLNKTFSSEYKWFTKMKQCFPMFCWISQKPSAQTATCIQCKLLNAVIRFICW